jgi:hypothetical protein
MRYVKLTLLNDDKIYINLDHTCGMMVQADYTLIDVIDRPSFRVKETPEEILIKLPVIGG